jgi:hypothetical protein
VYWATFWAIFSLTRLVTLLADLPMDLAHHWKKGRREETDRTTRRRKVHREPIDFLTGFSSFPNCEHIQGCQMVYFHSKNPNLGIFWRTLEWKMLLYFMKICYRQFTAIWYIL